MIIFLVRSKADAIGSGVATIMLESNCKSSQRLSLLLHLLLNIVSTCIIASSNFFMQVLNAPTRKEVDQAHIRQQMALEIDVSSIRNGFHVSRWKSICWFLFSLSSLPIHLLFNSTIFESNYQGANWRMTLAAEGFTRGKQYFVPGASLSLSGPELFGARATYYGGQRPSKVTEGILWDDSFTNQIPMEYNTTWIESFAENVSSTAINSGNWARLSASEFIKQYSGRGPRITYGDVVLIVQSHDISLMNSTANGWTRDAVFGVDGPVNYTTKNGELVSTPTFAEIWDPTVPQYEANSLVSTTHFETFHRNNP
jgi:hypothetical protein